jgi:hypothetical protein
MGDESERGSATDWSQTCPHCGAAIQRIARRCVQCGGDVEGDESALPVGKPRSELVRIIEEVIAVAPVPMLLALLGLVVFLWLFGL